MRVKFEATDATGKVRKRSSMSHIYSHCVVIHFAAHPPSKLWPMGVAACSHAEWVGKRGKCDAIPEGQEPRAGNLLQLGLAGCSRLPDQRFHKAMTFQEAKSASRPATSIIVRGSGSHVLGADHAPDRRS